MNPVIILVAPQMGENIGATARAMKNFGLNELRLQETAGLMSKHVVMQSERLIL